VASIASITTEQMQAARIITGVAMALFIGIALVPGLRQHAGRLRLGLLVIYLAACLIFVAYVLWQ
jgi:high-affinity Fe2+/Pb2+ permease